MKMRNQVPVRGTAYIAIDRPTGLTDSSGEGTRAV